MILLVKIQRIEFLDKIATLVQCASNLVNACFLSSNKKIPTILVIKFRVYLYYFRKHSMDFPDKILVVGGQFFADFPLSSKVEMLVILNWLWDFLFRVKEPPS